ncbi:MAG: hypothetical protein E7421_05570 [Ruminococcaceae bacterium]|nr:hypothetical protein [Oscillospiraceae bacterium]
MKKAISILLVLVALLSLCACKNNKTADPSDSTPSTTAGTETSTDGTEGTTGATQATPTDGPTTAPTDAPTTAPNNKPTTPPATSPTTPPATQPTSCSHSWNNATCTTPKTCTKCGATEGNAAGHSWSAATCVAPKTCKTCNITEGTKGEHTYTNGVCSACGATNVLNPKTNLSTKEYVGNFKVSGTDLIGAGIQKDGDVLLVLDRIFTSEPDEDHKGGAQLIYKGKTYYSVGAGQTPHYYELTDTEVVIKGGYWGSDDTEAVTIKLILQGDGTLKVTYSTNANFPVGAILTTDYYNSPN